MLEGGGGGDGLNNQPVKIHQITNRKQHLCLQKLRRIVKLENENVASCKLLSLAPDGNNKVNLKGRETPKSPNLSK